MNHMHYFLWDVITHSCLNSSPPSAAYIRQWIGSALKLHRPKLCWSGRYDCFGFWSFLVPTAITTKIAYGGGEGDGVAVGVLLGECRVGVGVCNMNSPFVVLVVSNTDNNLLKLYNIKPSYGDHDQCTKFVIASSNGHLCKCVFVL